MTNYIFISYAHKDTERVMPVIKKLRESDYNVWYDDGIDPGTEWAVNIATHIEGCAYFIAFMSQAYLDSLNCREEWNFARDEQKSRFLVYIEDVKLPSEMRLRSGMIQNLFMHKYDDAEVFYSKLFAASGIEACKNAVPEEIKRVVAETEDRAAGEETIEPKSEEEQPEEDETIEAGVERQKEDWEEYFEIEESEEGITICECIEDAEEIVIPDRINGKLVIRIDDRAFEECENLSSVVIPKGVIEIGESAFEGCHNLSSIVIPEGVTEIGRRAFDSCFSLSNVVIPEGITEISEGTFNACLSLSSVEIPKSVTTIWFEAFNNCLSLSSIVIPESVTVIYAPAFEKCSSLSVELLDIITCEKLAMGGHEEANIKMLNKYLELARIYSDGDGVEKDENEAAIWYRKADDFGKSQCELICRYLGGEDVWLSKQKLGGVYCDVIKRGELRAHIRIQIHTLENNNRLVRSEDLIIWNQQAANGGNAYAQFETGRNWEKKQKLSEAMVWYEKAAEQGEQIAQERLAQLYEKKGDIYAAIRWYGEELAKEIQDGKKFLQNEDEWTKYYVINRIVKKSLHLADLNAKIKDWENVVQYYEIASEYNDVMAEYGLAMCYMIGRGVKQNFEKSFEYFRKAAEQGHSAACLILSMLYGTGRGVERNEEEARHWHKKAYERKN